QFTEKLGVPIGVPSVCTLLVGATLSRVFDTTGVVSGDPSKLITALFWIAVPFGVELAGRIVNSTLPSPCGGVRLGGRNPSTGLVGGCSVVLSSVVNDQVSRRVGTSRLAEIRTIRLSCPRSTSRLYCFDPGSGNR